MQDLSRAMLLLDEVQVKQGSMTYSYQIEG